MINNLFQDLQKTIGYEFKDHSLLQLALKHKSSGKPNNERLEFLGDAILGTVIADLLYNKYLDIPEGQLTTARASLVNGGVLSTIANRLQLEELLQLGKGERQSGNIKPSILEDAFEALIGAIYLDSNFETTQTTLLNLLDIELQQLDLSSKNFDEKKDAKTRLQEFVQTEKSTLPAYTVKTTEGPPHATVFTVTCKIALIDFVSEGMAGSRRKAEQQAAEKMLEHLSQYYRRN